MLPVSKSPVHLSRQETLEVVSENVTCFPRVISELVTAYAFGPYVRALNALTFDENGKVREPEVSDAIKAALISNECEPQFKHAVFKNIPKRLQDNYFPYEAAFRSICADIAQQGYRINLDGIHLKDLYLFGVDFTNVSARGSTFSEVEFNNCKFTKGDLTNAKFTRCTFFRSTMYEVSAIRVHHKETLFIATHVTNMVTDDPSLEKFCKFTNLKNDDGQIKPTTWIENLRFTTTKSPHSDKSAKSPDSNNREIVLSKGTRSGPQPPPPSDCSIL